MEIIPNDSSTVFSTGKASPGVLTPVSGEYFGGTALQEKVLIT